MPENKTARPKRPRAFLEVCAGMPNRNGNPQQKAITKTATTRTNWKTVPSLPAIAITNRAADPAPRPTHVLKDAFMTAHPTYHWGSVRRGY